MKLPREFVPRSLAFRIRRIPNSKTQSSFGKFLAKLLAVLTILPCGSASLPAEEAQRPNVVMVFIADMGWG